MEYFGDLVERYVEKVYGNYIRSIRGCLCYHVGEIGTIVQRSVCSRVVETLDLMLEGEKQVTVVETSNGDTPVHFFCECG